MKKGRFSLIWPSLKDSFRGFGEDKVIKLSAALSYYTVFSLAPLMIVIIYLAGIILGQEAAENTIFTQLNGIVGADTAAEVQQIIRNASLSNKTGLALVVGIVTLLIGATTVFGEIQDSINGIWGLKPKPKMGLIKLVQTRLLSFGMIASLGFLLLVSLAATTVVEGLGNRLKAVWPDLAVTIFYIINLILNLAVISALFGVIFKVLPDARIKWKDVWPGALATALLFMAGKFLISFYIAQSDFRGTFGAAGSVVILLVWVYFSAMILYFGAEFTQAYALNKGARIVPDKYAQWDKEAVISGAKPHLAEHVHLPKPKAKSVWTGAQPVLPVQKLKKDKGMATVVVGLLLYLLKPGHGNRIK